MPERTASDWAEYIAAAIRAAETDGYQVCINNTCCGCSDMYLIVEGYTSCAGVIW